MDHMITLGLFLSLLMSSAKLVVCFFNSLSERPTIDIRTPTQSQDNDSTEDTIRVSNAASVQALTFLNSKKKDLVMLDQFKVVKQVFLKFNTQHYHHQLQLNGYLAGPYKF